jgi:DNA-binding PadR family transcriptional regulator
VLALVIERPSYAFELSKRFEQRFGDLLLVGSSRVYQVIDAMRTSGLIEPMASDVPDGTERQPKLHYRATAEGALAYRQRLAEDLQHDPQRGELLLRLLSIVTHDPRALLDLVDRYERVCLDAMAARRSEPARAKSRTARGELLRALIVEQRRLELEARLKWIAFARKRIGASVGTDQEPPP